MKAMLSKGTLLHLLQWSGLFLSLFFSAFFIAWHLLSSASFFYSSLYDFVGVGENIRIYGPKNIVRPHFELTNKQEQERLFSKIVTAIHSNGEGLNQLNYHTPDGRELGPFLTDAEIVHLQDVAHLVNGVNLLGGCTLVSALVLLTLLWGQSSRPPPLFHYNIIGLIGLLLLIGIPLVLGSEYVFNQLHIWIFPEDHQWYFLYQESLMSMFMKAPDLFAYIAIEILLAGITLYAGMLLVLKKSFLLRT